jgi:UDP-glucuronate 4-epimerase
LKVMVTGCAGFIGWKVTELLLSQGHMVAGIDNLNSAYDPRLKEWRLVQLKENPHFSFHKLDISLRENLPLLTSIANSSGNTDAIINLAARAGVRHSVKNPWVYYETNVTGTLNLLELCRDQGIKKFALSSTSSIYADGERPFREDALTDRPNSPYAASKKAAELLCYNYHYLHGLDVSILRYFTVYGPAGRPDMSIFRFIKWIAEEEPLVLYGDGLQERDFTFVEDIAEGTVAALKPLGFEIINLGSDHPVTIRSVIEDVEALLEQKATVEEYPAHAADVAATWADNSKALSVLGWTPKTPFHQGLKRSVQWYQENRSWARKITI